MLGLSGRGRALFIFPTDVIGGAERVTLTLAQAASENARFAGVDCLVLAARRSGALDEFHDRPRCDVIYIGGRSQAMSLVYLAFFLIKSRYSFVFSSFLHINAICSLLRAMSLFVTDQLVARESTLIFNRNFGRRGPFIRALYHLYGAQDVVICQTDAMLAQLVANVPDRVGSRAVVRENPINMSWIEAGMQEDVPPAFGALMQKSPLIAWCGRLSDIKDPLLAVDILACLKQRGLSEAHLVMIGDGPLREEVLNHARCCNVESSVTLLGQLKFPSSVTSRCDVGLLTSRVEGFPNVVLEMLAAGVNSVVCTACWSDGADLFQTTIVQDRDPDRLANAILNAAENDDPNALNEFVVARSPQKYLAGLLEHSGARVKKWPSATDSAASVTGGPRL